MSVEQELCNFLLPLVRQSETYLLALCRCHVPRAAFLQVYKTLTPVELLPEDEKKELKQYVINSFPGEGKDWLTGSAKVIYTAGKMM